MLNLGTALGMHLTNATVEQSAKIVAWYITHSVGSKATKGEPWNPAHRLAEGPRWAMCVCGALLSVRE